MFISVITSYQREPDLEHPNKTILIALTYICRRTVRACLILVPLLGIQFLLFPFRPAQDVFEYNIVVAIFTSFQVGNRVRAQNDYRQCATCIFHEIWVSVPQKKWQMIQKNACELSNEIRTHMINVIHVMNTGVFNIDNIYTFQYQLFNV